MSETLQEKRQRAIKIISILKKATQSMTPPAGQTIVEEYGQDPYAILASCLLSLRTKDPVSLAASRRLFKLARTPQQMLKIPIEKIERAIYPSGFYRQKAKQLHAISKMLIDEFDSQVPSGMDELLSLPGVGRKTANLVRADAFNIPAICVDTHVHRISNRLGLVDTKTPEETEQELEKLLPKKYWAEYNRLLVMWGQNICVPQSPFCSMCAISDLCPRIGVTKSR